MRSFTAFSDQDQEDVWKILQSTVKFKMSHIDAKLLIFPADLQFSSYVSHRFIKEIKYLLLKETLIT